MSDVLMLIANSNTSLGPFLQSVEHKFRNFHQRMQPRGDASLSSSGGDELISIAFPLTDTIVPRPRNHLPCLRLPFVSTGNFSSPFSRWQAYFVLLH